MELQATFREADKPLKQVRKNGQIPAVFYGHGMENRALVIERKAFQSVYKQAGENTVVTLSLGDVKQPSLIYDVQHHPVSGEVIHVDFYGVRMDEKIIAAIPLEFVGEAPAVKEKSGIVAKAFTEIEVEALPADLPHSIIVDLSVLTDIDQTLYVKDLHVSPKVKIVPDAETAVVTVTPPAKEEEIAPPAMDVADVKVESEEEVAKRAADKEAEPNVKT